jgi:hypothetical protein
VPLASQALDQARQPATPTGVGELHAITAGAQGFGEKAQVALQSDAVVEAEQVHGTGIIRRRVHTRRIVPHRRSWVGCSQAPPRGG